MSTHYEGTRTKTGCKVVKVEEGQEPKPLDIRLDLWNHSPSGAEWGYAGSGPAQLALGLLADVTGNDRIAVALHQEFKFGFVTKFPDEGWQMTAEEIQRWADLHAATLDLSEWDEEYPDDEEAEDHDAGDQIQG